MKKSNSIKTKEFVVQHERTHFLTMLAKNPNYFGNFPGSKLKANFEIISNTYYEELHCVGYNPETQNMEATFSIKRPSGFSGNLCSPGSFQYVRFYLDFHDGAGFIDQGMVAVNVHDIPNATDCKEQSIFPIMYTATLKKKTIKSSACNNPTLPTLKAILSWSYEPPADSPDWPPVWGNSTSCDVQIKPWLILKEMPPYLSEYLSLAIESPELSINQIEEISGINIKQLKQESKTPDFAELVKISLKKRVPAKRFAYKSIQNMIKFPTSEITMMDKNILSEAKVKVSDLIDELSMVPDDTSKANVDYEELTCIGLNYHSENLVATIQIKKVNGYWTDLCGDGSKEYISFWIDWDDGCSWKYLNTVQLNAYNIQKESDCLCYSVSLPLDTTFHKKLCGNPNVVRLRGVLSWNKPPSTTDPDKLEYYGNRIDTHIQIKPGDVLTPGEVIPLFNIIGGIDVAHVNDTTGLTKPGSFFAYNGLSVPTGAPFGGRIVLNGPTFPGHRYKITVTNLTSGLVTDLNNSFVVVGRKLTPPYVQYTNQSVDSAGYYHFLPVEKNTLNVLARFTPGTNDKLLVEMRVDGISGVFSKTIQMDNIWPDLSITVNDGGDCTHYSKGDTITGSYSVYDEHIYKWRFRNRWTAEVNGTSNVTNTFSIATAAHAYPCGYVSLYAIDKTIVNSQSIGHEKWASYIICLKEKE